MNIRQQLAYMKDTFARLARCRFRSWDKATPIEAEEVVKKAAAARLATVVAVCRETHDSDRG